MRFGVDAINFGAYGEPATFQEVARAAEAAEWDGLFCWDHVASAWDNGPPTADPWVLLTAAACVTERLIVGTNVTPLPRRRPHVLAAQVATLDRLSGGRVVLGVGSGGVPAEFERFGEHADAKARAEMLDEALDIITALWTGEPVRFAGRHYQVDSVQNRLVPVQRPRVPIWVGGNSAAAHRRAARWDGWTLGILVDETGRVVISPDDVAAQVADVVRHRTAPFAIVVGGYSEPTPAGVAMVRSYADAGAPWWLEEINGYRGSDDPMLARAKAGPPR